MKTNGKLTPEQMKDIPQSGLARKYKCSPQYVRQILRGYRDGRRSYIADEIRKDATRILEILES